MPKEVRFCKCGCGVVVEKNYKKCHGRRGKINSVEHNLKISRSNKENPPSFNMSYDTKQKMIDKLKLMKVPDERKKRISENCKKNGVGKWMKDRKLSECCCKKISEKLTGHITSEETKKKISEKNSGEKNGMFGKTQIINHLDCKFYRYNEKKNELYEIENYIKII